MMRRDVQIYREVALMRAHFPSFRNRIKHGVLTCHGTLQPTEQSPCYHVQLIYACGSRPKIWVRQPKLREDAPHRYPDKSLCLYHPDDESWSSDSGIAKTIVPWTAEWLYCYELWLVTGVWAGPEAPHLSAK
jgi:hypothetical protein